MSTISLVTGANRGIGREVCRQLAELGHTVILTSRDSSAAAEAAQAIRAEPLQLDVTDPASVTRAARWAQDRHGKLDVLVNNAAITYDTWQRAVSADLAVVREAAETNLYGPWLMIQESCRCSATAIILGSSTFPARRPRWPAWAAAPRLTRHRRSR
jgi:NAD(P)-dependent dehydrogenase (short-subunit alcohol dehydrogenase family)